MAKPNKPTKEELLEAQRVAEEAAEELEGRQQIPQDEEEDEQDTSDADDGENEEEAPEEEEEPQEEEVEAEPSKELYKRKFKASSRQNQKVEAKNRVINKAITEANSIPEPTEKEMQDIYGDSWEIASDIERISLKETQMSKRWREKIATASDQAEKIEKWNDQVVEFVNDPANLNDNPELEGKEQDFVEYATKDENNNVPFNVLIGAFLHERGKEVRVKKQNNKGRMFDRALGGDNEKPQPKKTTITLEEARKLRETDYSKYKEMLAEGKIEMNL